MRKIKGDKNLTNLFLIVICFSFFQVQIKAEDQQIFGNPRQIYPGAFFTSVALGDLDNDGDLDFAGVQNMFGDFVAFNDGNGNFTWHKIGGVLYDVRSHLTLADVNLDGYLDFINQACWYLNDGSGNFNFAGNFGIEGEPAVTAGDLNGDLFPEIIVPPYVFVNDGAEGFIQGQYIFGASTQYAVAVGDVDNDGDLDITTRENLLINDGSGYFVLSDQNLHLGPLPDYGTYGREFGDLNNDGYLDLVMCGTRFGCYVLLNDGSGNFNWTGEWLQKDSGNVAIGDINQDGYNDIVTSGFINKVYFGDGTGFFGDPVQYIPVGGSAPGDDVALGDLNGDGLLDLVHAVIPTAYLNLLPGIIPIDIDIKPDSEVNIINLTSNGNVPVAIFGSVNFNVKNIDPSTVTLAGAPIKANKKGKLLYSFVYVNSDGYMDMLVHINIEDLLLSQDDTIAVLEGKTTEMERFKGEDSVKVIK